MTSVYSVRLYIGMFVGGEDSHGKSFTVHLSDGLAPTGIAQPHKELFDVTRRRQ